MRVARLVLLAGMVLGLAAIYVAARGHLSGLRQSFVESHEKSVLADLRQQARERARLMDARMKASDVVATYTVEGRLLRPAPPFAVSQWRVPTLTPAMLLLARGKFEQALKEARTSEERATIYIRMAERDNDADMYRRALSETAILGSELYYLAALKMFLLEGREPPYEWLDDVSAMLGGRSRFLAEQLLKEAGVKPIGDMRLRVHYAQLRARTGYFVAGDELFLGERTGQRIQLRTMPIAALHAGAGEIVARMPPPFDSGLVRGNVDPRKVEADLDPSRRRLVFFYTLAALLLVAGTVYAYIAIGRFYRLSEAKSEFVANVTHELKTPIANIRLYGETLQAGRVQPEDRQEFVQTILDESARLEVLVDGLLHAARGPKKLHMQSLDAKALIEETEARWRARLEQEGYEFDVEAADLPRVHGDKEALLRAISNLIDNARKYSAGDRRIKLKGEAANGTVRLTVFDRGPGIPVRARSRVLKPFTRIESADRKETAGTGLGLSLVVACLEAHGGRIEIADAPGKGAAVTLELPGEKS